MKRYLLSTAVIALLQQQGAAQSESAGAPSPCQVDLEWAGILVRSEPTISQSCCNALSSLDTRYSERYLPRASYRGNLNAKELEVDIQTLCASDGASGADDQDDGHSTPCWSHVSHGLGDAVSILMDEIYMYGADDLSGTSESGMQPLVDAYKALTELCPVVPLLSSGDSNTISVAEQEDQTQTAIAQAQPESSPEELDDPLADRPVEVEIDTTNEEMLEYFNLQNDDDLEADEPRATQSSSVELSGSNNLDSVYETLDEMLIKDSIAMRKEKEVETQVNETKRSPIQADQEYQADNQPEIVLESQPELSSLELVDAYKAYFNVHELSDTNAQSGARQSPRGDNAYRPYSASISIDPVMESGTDTNGRQSEADRQTMSDLFFNEVNDGYVPWGEPSAAPTVEYQPYRPFSDLGGDNPADADADAGLWMGERSKTPSPMAEGQSYQSATTRTPANQFIDPSYVQQYLSSSLKHTRRPRPSPVPMAQGYQAYKSNQQYGYAGSATITTNQITPMNLATYSRPTPDEELDDMLKSLGYEMSSVPGGAASLFEVLPQQSSDKFSRESPYNAGSLVESAPEYSPMRGSPNNGLVPAQYRTQENVDGEHDYQSSSGQWFTTDIQTLAQDQSTNQQTETEDQNSILIEENTSFDSNSLYELVSGSDVLIDVQTRADGNYKIEVALKSSAPLHFKKIIAGKCGHGSPGVAVIKDTEFSAKIQVDMARCQECLEQQDGEHSQGFDSSIDIMNQPLNLYFALGFSDEIPDFLAEYSMRPKANYHEDYILDFDVYNQAATQLAIDDRGDAIFEQTPDLSFSFATFTDDKYSEKTPGDTHLTSAAPGYTTFLEICPTNGFTADKMVSLPEICYLKDMDNGEIVKLWDTNDDTCNRHLQYDPQLGTWQFEVDFYIQFGRNYALEKENNLIMTCSLRVCGQTPDNECQKVIDKCDYNVDYRDRA